MTKDKLSLDAICICILEKDTYRNITELNNLEIIFGGVID